MHKTLLASAVASLLITVPAQAPAQVAHFDIDELMASCQIDCAGYIANLIAQLRARGVPQAQINEQVGLIAATLVEASASAPPEVRQQYAAGLQTIADGTDDPEQAANIRTVAVQIESGEDVTDIEIAVGASPA